MSGLSASAEQARESARRGDGRFGLYAADESAVELPMTTGDEQVRALGAQVAARAEELAGISEDEVRQNWQNRLDAARRHQEDVDPVPLAPQPEDLDDEDKVWIFQRRMAIRNGEAPEESGFGRGDAPESVIGVEFDRPASAKWREASAHRERVEAGVDPDTREEMRQLTDGYLAALSESQAETQARGEAAADLTTLLKGGQGGMIGIGRVQSQADRRDATLGRLVDPDRTGL